MEFYEFSNPIADNFVIDVDQGVIGGKANKVIQQGEHDARYLQVELVQNGVPVDLTNCDVYFLTRSTKSTTKPTMTLCEIFDTEKGNVKVQVKNYMTNKDGVIECEFVRIGHDKTILPFKKFNLTVDGSIYTDDAIESSEPLHALVDALATVREVEQYLGSEFMDLEAKYAGELSKTNAQLSQLANEKYINQEDFIETIKRNYKPKSMNFKVNDFETKVFSIQNIINNEKAIQYSTRTASANSVQDGYILFGEGRYGTIDMQPVLTGRQSADELIGNWNTSYPPSYYATTVGDTMKKEFIGDRIDFLSFGDNRGGVWEFILDENIENKVTVSTWQATSGAKPLVTLFENLENKKHTLIGTFKGDDPQNPPSSGTGTSRGWTYYNDGENGVNSFYSYVTIPNVTPIVTPLFGSSNKEFAIEVRKKGTNYPYHFCPYHDAVTAFKIEEPIIKIDGELVNLKTGDLYKDINEVKITQRINAINPESDDVLAEVSTITVFRSDGTVSVDGKYIAKVDLDVNSAYGIMFMVDATFNTKLCSSINKTYLTSDTPVGTNLYLSEESDKTTSFISLSENHPNICAAVTFNNPKTTLRSGLGGKVEKCTWIEYRNSTLTKLYQQVYGKTSINAGEVFRFSGTFIVAEIDGVFNIF